jgi:hypothetical protein
VSYSKIEWERLHPEDTDPLRCLLCNVEATPEAKGRRIGDDSWLCPKHKEIPEWLIRDLEV